MERKPVYKKRIERVKAAMVQEGIDCMIITPSSDLVYLLGQEIMADERFNACILCARGQSFVIANTVYEQEVRFWGIEDIVYWKDGENPWLILSGALSDRGIVAAVIGVEPSMPSRFLLPLAEESAQVRFVLNSRIMDFQRRFKDETEQNAMREACFRCKEALVEVIKEGRAWIGRTEEEFSSRLCKEMAVRGIKRPGALVCAGANSAIPHYLGNQGVILEGSCLLVDFGGSYEGYCSDMSRTFYFSGPEGEDRAEFEAIYQIVLGALYDGHRAAQLGTRMEEIDRAARGFIEKHGYGRYFVHRTGHGIGIDTHEEPCAAEGEISVIQPGMCFSIEPGIYLPGKFGIRIEDQVLMLEDGQEILHDFQRELMIL